MRTHHLLFTAVLALAGCATPVAERTLYEELGGEGGIATLADTLIDIFATDLRVAPTFAKTDMKRFRAKLIEQLCEVSDGPCRYTGDSMADSHAGLGITEAQFNAVVEDLQLAMDRLAIPERTQNRLLERLAPMRKDIIYR